MRTLASLLVLFVASATAQAQPAITCDPAVVVSAVSDADLDARDCALQKLMREAKGGDERDQCVFALREVVREQLRRDAARRVNSCPEDVALADPAVLCDPKASLANDSEAELQARACALRHVRQELRRIRSPNSGLTAEESNCLRVAAEIARERLRRHGARSVRPTCPD